MSVAAAPALPTAARWLLALTLAALAYALIGAAPPVADDWFSIDFIGGWVRDGSWVARAFEPYESHWSPVFVLGSGAALALDPAGHGVVPVRLFNALALALSLAAFLQAALWLGARRLPLLLATALLAFHQGAVGVQYQWDSIGPMWGDATARWALVLALGTLLGKVAPRLVTLAAIAGLTFFALASKETALATVAGFGLLAVGWAWTARRAGRPITPALVALAPMALSVLVFLAIRQTSGGATNLEGTPYGIASPLVWPKSAALLGSALLSPLSTLELWSAIHLRAWPVLALGALLVAATAWLLWPALREPHPLTATASPTIPGWALALAIPAAFCPMVLLRHVSENYLTPSIFFLALAFALALSRRLEAAPSPRRTAVLALAALIVALHVAGWLGKRDALAHAGQAAIDRAERVLPALLALPDGAAVELKVAEPARAVPPYSIYGAINARGVLFVRIHLAGRDVDVIASHQTPTHRATLTADAVLVEPLAPADRADPQP